MKEGMEMSRGKRLQTNVAGDLFVNDRCINCDTCRQLAPETFQEIGEYSAVIKQPSEEFLRNKALHALLACPTAAIESINKEGLSEAVSAFPIRIAPSVYYCGYTSQKSFGASSYFIQHPQGNWLVDAPRFVPALVKRLEQMGGIRYVFLTHQDDVADAAQYAAHFRAERIIHEFEKHAQPDAEHMLRGKEAVDWSADFRIIPVPGHTKGHLLLIYYKTYLFSGDHLAWSRNRKNLTAFKDHCWYSWSEQLQSLQRLQQETFEWVLPGHGERIHLQEGRMQQSLAQLLTRFEET